MSAPNFWGKGFIEMASYYPLEIPRCEHIKDNGVRCGAPALRGKTLCYHHHDVHAKRLKPGHKGYKFRPIETAESVKMQVADIAQSAHDGSISLQLARVLLYAIQIGAQQMNRLGPSCHNVETEVTEAMKAEEVMEEATTPPGTTPLNPTEGLNGAPEAEDGAPAVETTPLKPAEGLNGAPETMPENVEIPPFPTDGKDGAPDAARGRAASITGVGATIDEEEMRRSIFHPDPEKVRAYWTRHLPPEVADLRCPSGDLVYTPPAWLPLTEEQLAYLRDHQGPADRRLHSPEERENYERLTLHSTHGMVKPPLPEQIIKCYNDLWNGKNMWDEIDAQIKKNPKNAAKILVEQLAGKGA
jgi:hypothetical protein